MITLHQMLHGYRLGHNYLQGSIVLSSSHDMDKIATLSDWSEYVGIDNRRDYITGYPLDESPYYVIAKTWYADGMRRPGCVWTHSLLISKDDLGKIVDFRSLLSVFDAPVSESEKYDEYRTQVILAGEESYEPESELAETQESLAAETYTMFLSTSPEFYMTELGTMQSQELMLSLLNNLPAAMIWRKSFCTGTSLPRSYEGKYLSLQLVTHGVNGVKYYAHAPMPDWSQMVAFSILTNSLQVSRLIHHFEEELGDSPEKLIGFLRVVLLINRQCKDEEEKNRVLREILQELTTTFPGVDEAQNIKESVLQPSLARDFGGEENFLYTISTEDIASFTEEQVEYGKRLRDLSTSQFMDLLKRLYNSDTLNEWGIHTVNEVAMYISYAEIADLRKTDKTFFQAIICSSPELLNQIVWADFTKEELQSTLSVFSDKNMVSAFRHWRELLRNMLGRNVVIARELARMIFLHDKLCVAEYLDYLNSTEHQSQVSVSKEMKCYPEVILSWLSKTSSINYDVAYVLITSIDEVSPLVKNRGSKIWMPLYNLLNDKDPIQYFVFMYRLSFHWQDKEALSYLRQAFYPIHALLAQDKLDYSLWYRVEPYTERLFFPFWDKCKKMRKMVIERLKDAGYSKSEVANYTPDAQTNEWLMNEW